MPSPDFSPPLLHPPWFFPKNKKRLELEEVVRKASARGPQLLPRRRVRGGPEPVAPSVGPFVRPLLLNWGEGTPGRVSAAAVASELYPQIKKKRGGGSPNTLITATFSHLARIIISGIICLIKIAASLTPSPSSWAPRPLLIIISIIKMICWLGSPRLLFPASARWGLGSPSPRKGTGGGGSRLGVGGFVPAARQSALSALVVRKESPSHYRAVARTAGGGGAPIRGTGWRGAQGSPIFPPQLGLGV